jgi:hypothetical protein
VAEKLIPGTLTPWRAAGPGWANSGVTATVRDTKTLKDRRLTLYAKDFDGTVLEVAIVAAERLEAEFSVALAGKRRAPSGSKPAKTER